MRGIISRGGIIAGKADLMFNNLNLPIIISRIFVLLTAFAVHEFAHAWAADRFGDPTPRDNGRLTLNPMAHLDPMGSLMLIVVGFGWAKPVPINPYALSRRSSAAVMWVSLAGPASNLLMAIIASIPFQLGLVSQFGAFSNPGQLLPSLDLLLWEFVSINLLLFLFNLIPISPLDGEKILYYLLPPEGKRIMDNIRPYGPLILLVLVFSGFLLPNNFNILWDLYLGPAMNVLISILVG
jgi:Zn-dependent protease